MTRDERHIATLIFQNRVLKAKGNAYEELFTRVMQCANPDFMQVKPQGRFGDKKNDGFDPYTGTYYQVYAPEDLSKTEDAAIKKLHTDFNGLMAYWPTIGYPVKEFNYVLNDRFSGVGPEVYKNIQELNAENPSIKIGLFLTNKLQDVFQLLDEQRISNVIDFIPSADVSMIETDVLHNVIIHIMDAEAHAKLPTIPENPDFENKVKFNGLSSTCRSLMLTAMVNEHAIDDYFDNNNNFMRDELRNRFNSLYLEAKGWCEDADQIFTEIWQNSLPEKATNAHSNAVLTLMAYYFECCDIFESPEK